MKLTKKLLNKIISISNKYNEFPASYITQKKIKGKTLKETLLNILFYSEYELYTMKEIKKIASKYLNKNLSEMPLYLVRDNLNEKEKFFNIIPIIARWRLLYNIDKIKL